MRLLGQGLLYFLSIGVAVYTLVAYVVVPLGDLVHPEMKAVFQAHPIGIYAHIFCSLIALALGPFQFAGGIRDKYRAFHRWSGRIYLSIGVLVGGLSGLYMAQYAFGGIVSRLGFSILAIAWLTTGLFAYLAIRKGDVDTHRRWMIVNFSLTFAAVTLRIYLGIFIALGMKFEEFYPVVSWLCWVPNVLLVAWALNSRSKQPRTGSAPAHRTTSS